ncbi:hypothetical protein HK100_001820 [Physocladia obscura]|uniref:Uncharacterized protein n=1 Tax=Physocladia obscura TaxID=109957 RepID=A0AAD5T2A7_9FUNG|nr:hypothetical protein HK100_001820 [Physocladia obscura]
MGNKLSLHERISNADKTQVLNLSDARLVKLPSEVLVIKQLRNLDLSGNRLDTLPPQTAKVWWTVDYLVLLLTGAPQWTALRTLNLAHNSFATVPLDLAALTLLETLNLSHNVLKTLPAAVFGLPRLRTLNCAANRLATLPGAAEGQGDGGLAGCPALVSLDVSANALTALPSLRALGCLALQELLCADNRLAALPDDLAALPSLKIINVRNNALQSFPPAVLRNQSVVWIELDGNPNFDELSLSELDGYHEFELRRKDRIINREK